MSATPRERLIDTALELFNRQGYHATGIDGLLAEAGCAKMTLYHHFGSKEGLIRAALEARDARWRTWLRNRVETLAEAPRDRLLAVFAALDEWFRRPDFRGCLFAKAAAEYPDLADPIHRAAALHQREILGYLRGLAADAGAPRPARLARALMLLVQGAVAVTQVNGRVGAAETARAAAETLIAAALAARQPERG